MINYGKKIKYSIYRRKFLGYDKQVSSRNDAIQVILSEWNILKQIDFNNIQVNVTLGDVSQVAKQIKNTEQIEEDEDQRIVRESLLKMEEEMPD